jgi:hypothetical protein
MARATLLAPSLQFAEQRFQPSAVPRLLEIAQQAEACPGENKGGKRTAPRVVFRLLLKHFDPGFLRQIFGVGKIPHTRPKIAAQTGPALLQQRAGNHRKPTAESLYIKVARRWLMARR